MSKGNGSSSVATWFLPAERASAQALQAQIARCASGPVIDAIMQSWAGAVALLNHERQIVAINAGYLEVLGVDDPAAVMGLRPGEAVGCRFATEEPGGCGTARACASCGAAIAIATSMAKNLPEVRDCVITAIQGEEPVDLEFRVCASPLEIEAERFTLLTLQDITTEARRANLERVFFHDLSNLAMGLTGAAHALGSPDEAEAHQVQDDVRLLADRVAREIQLQRALATARPGSLRVTVEAITTGTLLDQLSKLFLHHPAAAGKTLEVTGDRAVELETDPFLLHRVLTNLLVNAFEATPAGGHVRLSVEPREGGAAFRVWNAGAIPNASAPRIFQRYFSTKPGEGRGQGTFAVKLFGEKYLKGAVGFSSAPETGTAFEVKVPRSIGRPTPAWAHRAHPT
jgi:signal transduction histidine kinase